MTVDARAVTFHTGVDDPAGYALRLLRKATGLGARLVVTAPADMLRRLDESLWTDDPGSFIPHPVWEVAERDSAAAAKWRLAPVWLVSDGESASAAAEPPPHRDVLLNLGSPTPEVQNISKAWPRIIEVVGRSEDQRRLGQARWRAWRALGIEPQHHAAS